MGRSRSELVKLPRYIQAWEAGLTFSMTQAKEIIKNKYKNQIKFAICLIGESGIGKTWIVEEAARELGIGFVKLIGVGLDAVDVRGIPKLVRKLKKKYTGEDWKQALVDYLTADTVYSMQLLEALTLPFTPGWKGILFLDEWTHAPQEVRNMFNHLCWGREYDGRKLSDDCLVVLAMNPPTDSRYIAARITVPEMDRVAYYPVNVEVSEWVRWASSHGVHQSVIGFVEDHPEYFSRLKGRRFHHLSDLLACHENLDPDDPLVRADVYASLDLDVADAFIKHLKSIIEISGIELLKGNKRAFSNLNSMISSAGKSVHLARIHREMLYAIQHAEEHLSNSNGEVNWKSIASNLVRYVRALYAKDLDGAISVLITIVRTDGEYTPNPDLLKELGELFEKPENKDITEELLRVIGNTAGKSAKEEREV